MMENKDTEEYDFLIEMQELHHKMDMLIERYGMREKVLSVVVTGVLNPFDDDNSTMKAIFSYNLESYTEMEIMNEFIKNTYEDQSGPDLDGMLGDLGISLN